HLEDLSANTNKMKQFPAILLWIITILIGCSDSNCSKELHEPTQTIQNGDIIFQTSLSRQSKAIQLATKSKYSHMGIIFESNGEFFVYEAVQAVKFTALKEWINRGESGHYVIKRLENADQILTASTLKTMKQIG